MILSDVDIKKHLKERRIKITPMPDLTKALGPSSLDLRLGDTFRIFNVSNIAVIDPFEANTQVTSRIKIQEGSYFILHPGEFVLAVTKERIELPADISARLEGRSSLGRLGIIIHSTAGSVNAGFCGRLTLELANMGKIPVKLYPNMRICALTFEVLSTPAQTPYSLKKEAKYLNQTEPMESRINQEANE